jgi:uncharacterized protein YjiS (DUF1127 family)
MLPVIASVGSTALVSIAQSRGAAVALDAGAPVRAEQQAKAPNSVARHVTAVWSRLIAWKMRRATQTILSSLDDRTLKDIGLQRNEIDVVLRNIRARAWPL